MENDLAERFDIPFMFPKPDDWPSLDRPWASQAITEGLARGVRQPCSLGVHPSCDVTKPCACVCHAPQEEWE